MVTLVGAFCALALCLPLRVADNCGICGVYRSGTQIGIYVDDGVHDQCGIVASYRRIEPNWLIIAGIIGGPYEHRPFCAAATYNAVEWYPFWGTSWVWPTREMPEANAYILPWVGVWTKQAPTLRERLALYGQVLKRKPRLVLWYYLND